MLRYAEGAPLLPDERDVMFGGNVPISAPKTRRTGGSYVRGPDDEDRRRQQRRREATMRAETTRRRRAAEDAAANAAKQEERRRREALELRRRRLREQSKLHRPSPPKPIDLQNQTSTVERRWATHAETEERSRLAVDDKPQAVGTAQSVSPRPATVAPEAPTTASPARVVVVDKTNRGLGAGSTAGGNSRSTHRAPIGGSVATGGPWVGAAARRQLSVAVEGAITHPTSDGTHATPSTDPAGPSPIAEVLPSPAGLAPPTPTWGVADEVDDEGGLSVVQEDSLEDSSHSSHTLAFEPPRPAESPRSRIDRFVRRGAARRGEPAGDRPKVSRVKRRPADARSYVAGAGDDDTRTVTSVYSGVSAPTHLGQHRARWGGGGTAEAMRKKQARELLSRRKMYEAKVRVKLREQTARRAAARKAASKDESATRAAAQSSRARGRHPPPPAQTTMKPLDTTTEPLVNTMDSLDRFSPVQADSLVASSSLTQLTMEEARLQQSIERLDFRLAERIAGGSAAQQGTPELPAPAYKAAAASKHGATNKARGQPPAVFHAGPAPAVASGPHVHSAGSRYAGAPTRPTARPNQETTGARVRKGAMGRTNVPELPSAASGAGDGSIRMTTTARNLLLS